jgi:ketosteroid isomerase-like protein
MKRFGLIKSLILLVVIAACFACQKPKNEKTSIDIEKEKQLVEIAINTSIGWAKNKDLSLLYGVIANDSNFLEVHPNNRVVLGIENFRKAEAFWMNPDFKAIRYEIRDLRINISQSGTVAWFFCYLDDINEWKGQPANWENTRWTGVLEKRDGKWRTVQQHFSFAVN